MLYLFALLPVVYADFDQQGNASGSAGDWWTGKGGFGSGAGWYSGDPGSGAAWWITSGSGSGFASGSGPTPDPQTPTPIPAPTPAPVPAQTPAPVSAQTPAPVHLPTSSPTSTQAVGGDVDEHGCKGSAGYQYCGDLDTCERSWELLSEDRGYGGMEWDAVCNSNPESSVDVEEALLKDFDEWSEREVELSKDCLNLDNQEACAAGGITCNYLELTDDSGGYCAPEFLVKRIIADPESGVGAFTVTAGPLKGKKSKGDGKGFVPAPKGPTEEESEEKKTNKVGVIIACCIVGMVFLGGGYYWWKNQPPKRTKVKNQQRTNEMSNLTGGDGTPGNAL